MFPMEGVGMAKDGGQEYDRLGTRAGRYQLALDPAEVLKFAGFARAYLNTQGTNAGEWRGGGRSVDYVVLVGMADVGAVCHEFAR